MAAAARELTARYDQVLTELAGRLNSDTGVVRLAFPDSMATSLVPRILRAFPQDAPGVRVLLRQEVGHEILRDLMTGASELAVTSVRPPGAFGWIQLQQERLMLIVPSTHRLRNRRRVGLHELAGEELVTTPVGFGYRSLIEGLLAEAGVAPRISFESGDLATIEGLVASGLGVAIVSEPFVGRSATIGPALTTPAARRTVGLSWRDDVELAPAAARFLAFVDQNKPFPEWGVRSRARRSVRRRA